MGLKFSVRRVTVDSAERMSYPFITRCVCAEVLQSAPQPLAEASKYLVAQLSQNAIASFDVFISIQQFVDCALQAVRKRVISTTIPKLKEDLRLTQTEETYRNNRHAANAFL